MARKSRKERQLPVSIEGGEKNAFLCAIYGRLSLFNSNRQDNGDSIQNQLRICHDFIQENEDLKLIDTYIDNGKKGVHFERPEFKRMMDDIRSGRINCIVVKDLSRFGRNYLEVGEYLEKIFPFLGVRFIAVIDEYDSLKNKECDINMTMPLKNMINELYAKDLSQKICTSMEARMEKGDFLPGRLCYGYIRLQKGDTFLVPDPVTASYVSFMFELRVKGASYEEIRRQLDKIHAVTPSMRKAELEVQTSKNKVTRYWTVTAIKKCLSNPVYLGHLVYHKEISAFYKGIKRKKVCPVEWSLIENTHQPLITQEIFDKVQEINQTAKKEYEKTHRNKKIYENMYRGIIKCGDCGTSMVHRTNKGRDNGFLCGRYKRSYRKECSIHSIKEETVHDIVLEQIRLQVQLTMEMEQKRKTPKVRNNISHMDKKKEQQIQELRRKKVYFILLREALYKNFVEGILEKEEYKELKIHYLERENELQIQIERMEQSEQYLKDMALKRKDTVSLFQRFMRRKNLNRDILENLVKEIKVFEDRHIEVVFKFEDIYQCSLCEGIK